MSLGILGGPGALGIEATPACRELQKKINVVLRAASYNPIGEDGKCGAATCGAVKEIEEKLQPGFRAEFDYVAAPGLCPAFTAPRKASGGFSTGPVAPLEPTSQAGFLGMDTNTLLLIGAVAVGAYVLFGDKKKKKTGASP